jgi:hypothetical protein
MRTKLSLDKEGYRFVIDGGLAGIAFICAVGAIIELLVIYWPDFKPFRAFFGALAVGVVFGMLFCRVAPIWTLEREDSKGGII